MKYNLIVWDLDDTLINSQQWHIQAYKDSFYELDANVNVEQFIREIDCGAGNALRKQCIENVEQILELKKKKFEAYKDKVQLNEKVLDMLEMYKDSRLAQCVLTNASDENTNFYLDKFNIKDYFTIIQTRDSYGLLKPDVRRGEYLLKNFWAVDGMTPLYIGDSEIDKQFAEDIGWGFMNIKDANENI